MSRSRLRRDRQAMKWARYTRRNGRVVGHDGDVRETPAGWQAIAWMLSRKVHGPLDVHRVRKQTFAVYDMFYNR